MANQAAEKQKSGRVVKIEKSRNRESSSESAGFFSRDERREATAFLLIAIAVVTFVSLILNPAELHGVSSSEMPVTTGKFGKWLATKVGIIFGFGGLFLPAIVGLWGYFVYKHQSGRSIVAKTLALVLGLLSTCALLGLVRPQGFWGGSLGNRLSEDLYHTFGIVSYIVLFFSIIISTVIGTPLSFSVVARASIKGGAIAAGHIQKGALLLWDRIAHRSDSEGNDFVSEQPSPKSQPDEKRPVSGKDVKEDAAEDNERRESFEKVETRIVTTPALEALKGQKTASLTLAALDGEASPPALTARKPQKTEKDFTDPEDYTLPPVNILTEPKVTFEISEEELRKKAITLEKTLGNFGIECKASDIVPGPTVTRFEIVPAPGVMVKSIVQRQDDIALNMKARSIRMEAPIPGKSAVGIEIPNADPQIVTLKEVITSEAFQTLRRKSPLTVCLGQDISGKAVAANLRTMPHLLIAGSTGSGKSVCINSIVNSLILSASPTEVKMLMVDPKVVELQEYNDIPHLLAPVITDARKAPRALMWAVEEMERRYQMLAAAGVREIDEYNHHVSQGAAKVETDEDDDFIDTIDELKDSTVKTEEGKMPFIVVIVDEFGDLMMVAKKECEDAIIRIAQKARAVGIHLIIATQRPSVNVITGIIKANLPSRIAFLVSSQVDSRTILDRTGAERLLGRGDMLFKPGDSPNPVRLQGCFIDGPEIKRVIAHYALQGPAERILNLEEDAMAGPNNQMAGGDDPLLLDAMKIVLEDGQASVSRIQRRLAVGHPRAARLVDIMEGKGLVTPPDGSKPRKLLFDEAFLVRYIKASKG